MLFLRPVVFRGLLLFQICVSVPRLSAMSMFQICVCAAVVRDVHAVFVSSCSSYKGVCVCLYLARDVHAVFSLIGVMFHCGH